ncbi:AMP-binding protein [Streptomyces syringium]|uniref:AMP-binding protein n=1 Tax=Streptomyces syringium TaxID=76729 RepID=UPI003452182A
MDRLANRLAHRLTALGVGVGNVVAVFLDQHSDRIVALLSVRKAGGAVLLLDPSYPQERTAFVLNDSGAHLVLAHAALAARLPAQGSRAVLLDTDSDTQSDADAGPDAVARAALAQTPVPEGRSQDLAFVTYTSGSTGRPKGVAIEHRSLVAYADAMTRVFTGTGITRGRAWGSPSRWTGAAGMPLRDRHVHAGDGHSLVPRREA